MKQYKTYKDSGVEWIGKIPEHWNLKRIKHTTYVKGRIGWKGLRSDEFLEESDSYVVTGTDFKNGLIKWDTCYQVPKERYDEDPFIQLKEDDLLITKDGTIGKIAVVKDMPKIATLNSGVFVTRPISDDYYAEYMFWILVSEVFISFYDFNKSGSTIQHLYQNVFNEFKFTCPPPEEQTQIANYLNHKTEQLDTLITKKKQLISLLQEERSSMINQAVTKGLDPNVTMKDSGIEWLGEIPEHWELKKGKYLFDIVSGYSPENIDSFISEIGVSYFKVNDLNDKSEIFNISKSKLKISSNSLKSCPKGSVLFPKRGAAISTNKVKINIDDCYFDTNIMGLIPYKEKINDRFLAYSIYNRGLWDIADTSTIPQINNKHIMPLEFTIPISLNEQEKIVQFLDFELNKNSETIRLIGLEIEYLKEYKTALISEVVTGKVDVREEILS
jgi:type I restriction enzyme S subunit